MSDALFLTVLAHGEVGAWDEIIPVAIAILAIVVGIVVFAVGRRLKARENETGAGEDSGS